MNRNNGKANPTPTQPRRAINGASFRIATPYIDPKDLTEEPQARSALPAASVSKEAKAIPFFDAKQTTLRRLLAASEFSPTVGRIMRDLMEMAFGGGIEAASDVVALYMGEANIYGQTVEQVVRQAAMDYLRTGNAFLEFVEVGGRRLIYNRTVGTVVPITEEYPMPAAMYAVEATWEVEPVHIKKDTPVVASWPEMSKDGGTKRAILHAKQPDTARHYWGLPMWYPALLWAEVDYLIAKHNHSRMNQNMIPPAIITLVGNVTDEEGEELIEALQAKIAGAGNAGKAFVQVVESPEQRASVELIEPKNEADFEKLQRMATQNIVTAFRWTMSLAGVATEGRLGSNQQMSTELNYVTAMAVLPFMREMVTRIIRPAVEFLTGGAAAEIKLAGSLPDLNSEQ